MRLRIVLVALAVAVGTLAPRSARADARSNLEKAHNAYIAHKYEDAESRLRTLLASNELKDPDMLADARMYLGAVLVAEKKGPEAESTFEQLLTDDPEYRADPLRVSLEAQDVLTDTRARMSEKLAAMQAEKVRQAQAAQAKLEEEKQRQARRLVMLEELAKTEIVIERHSRWLALVPFGVGQFQNGQTAEGWLFLAGEGLLAGGSVVVSALSLYYANRAYALQVTDYPTANAYDQASRISAVTADALAGGFLLAALGGIIHAQATFVPEKVETRKREIPPLSLQPFVGPGGVGIVGRF